jgi:FlaA1/EpsC-like NDP-sugar epimerase
MINSRNEALRTQLLQLTDALLIWFAFWIGWIIREMFRVKTGMGVEDAGLSESLNWVLYITVPLTPIVLERLGYYNNLRTKKGGTSVQQLFQAMLIILSILGIFAIITKQFDTRRLAFGVGLLVSFLLVIVRDWITRTWLHRQALDEDTKENVVIAGTGREMQDFLNSLDKEITATWHISQLFDLETHNKDDLFEVLKKESVARVIFVTKQTDFEKVSQAVEICELQGVEAWI